VVQGLVQRRGGGEGKWGLVKDQKQQEWWGLNMVTAEAVRVCACMRVCV
jgi:hypothetical protein